MSAEEWLPSIWRKSTRSDAEGENCVELTSLPAAVAVRDSKHPDGPKLAFSRAAFRTFARELATPHDTL